MATTVLGAGAYGVAVVDGGRSIELRRGDVPLLVFGPDAFQLGTSDEAAESVNLDPYILEAHASELVTYRSPTSIHATPGGDGVAIDLAYDGGYSARAFVRTVDNARFSIELQPGPNPAGAPGLGVGLVRVRAKTTGPSTEGFYGLGEWEDSVDHRGKLRPMQLEVDAEFESATNENHVPVPLLLGTSGWGMFVASTRLGAFDVAHKDPAYVEATFAVAPVPHGTTAFDLPAAPVVTTEGPEPLRLYLFASDAPIDLVEHYYALTGHPRLPAPWALGPWIWRDESRDQTEVEDDLKQIRELDLATSGIWIDRPYATAVNSFDFDPAKYTDAPALIAKAHAQGLKVALWSTPYLEAAAEPLLSQAKNAGYFPPLIGFPANRWGAPIDFTNPAAFSFWRGLVGRYTTMGIDGFKLDYGEDIAPSLGEVRSAWRFADGSDERTMHHGYPHLYHRVYASAFQGAEPPFLLCRAAKWGEHAATPIVIWPGDVDATFTKHGERFVPRNSSSGKEVVGVGGLPASVVMGLSLGVSGFPFFGADTGGYQHSPPEAELFVRWAEQTALSSVMQVGDSSSQPPWVFTPDNGRDATSLDIYRTYARLHMRLFPYEWTYANRIATDGRPIQRPLGFVDPELGVHPSDAYFFGEELLVLPVVTRGERVRRAVVPAGTWIDWWDGSSYASDGRTELSIDAPLEKLPLLLREGAIVPMLRPTIDTLSPADDPTVDSFARDAGLLWARLVPGPTRSFALWDGTKIERLSDGTITTTSGTVFEKGFVLEVIDTSEPTEVTRDSSPLPKQADLTSLEAATEGWAWASERRGTLWIKIGAATSQLRIR